MDDAILGHLREARAALRDELEADPPTLYFSASALQVTMATVETAMLWRQHDLWLRVSAVDEEELGSARR